MSTIFEILLIWLKESCIKEKITQTADWTVLHPFRRMNSNDNYSMQTTNKKGVTFDSMETLERNSNGIDRLMLLVSDMKMTMNRKQSTYKPRIYQGRFRNQNKTDNIFAPRNRSFSGGRNQSGNRGNYNYRNIHRHNYRNRSRGRWNNQ